MPIGKRKRTASDSVALEGKKCPIDELNSKESLQKIIEENCENQKSQQKLNEDIRDNQVKMMKKLENQQTLILDKLGNSDKSEAETKPSFNSVISPGFLKTNAPSTRISPIGRSFVLKHTFEDFSELEEGKRYFSDNDAYFGVSWMFYVAKKGQQLETFLWCTSSVSSGNWTIDTKCTFRVIGADGKFITQEFDCVYGHDSGDKKFPVSSKFIPWEELEKNNLVDGKLAVEAHVEIGEMSGVYKENLRYFDETNENYSDVVLKVKNQKFYVLKLFLASHSPYFDSLFLGNFRESNQSEIELSGISPDDFQNYLEVLYGDYAIDDTTVEGILLVADMYDTSIVTWKCEEFLIEKSEIYSRKKLQTAIRYNLEQLKNQLFSDMKTLADIKTVIPENAEDLDHSIAVELLNKSLALG